MGTEAIILIVLLMFSALFSASETALTTLSKVKFKKFKEQNSFFTKPLVYLKENPPEMLSAILVGNNIVNIWASVLAGSIAYKFFHGLSEAYIIGISTAIMTFVILVFGEITPKTIAIRHADFFAPICAPIIYVFAILLKPVISILMLIIRPVILLFGAGGGKGPVLSEEEIKLILRQGKQEGVIEKEESEMISSIFEFGETSVREVMTPRPDMHCLEAGLSVREALQKIVESGHSRIPVFEGNLDNIIGILYAKDLLSLKLSSSSSDSLKKYLRPALFIPEAKKVDELMHQMQAARTHLAIVVDEYGSVAGLVSLEDLVEEIVGEIHDEFERGEKLFEKIGEGAYLVDGGLSLGDLDAQLKIKLPQGDYDTVAGFTLSHLGKVPSVGALVVIEKYKISVERVHHRRITRVRIEYNGK